MPASETQPHASKHVHDQLLLYVKDFNTVILQREQAYQKLYEAHLNMLQRLARAAEFKDDDTGCHLTRMAAFSEMLARASGMSEEYCQLIRHASPMHDIGKIGIPDHILKKKGRLNEQEWQIMQKHAEYGADILGDSDVPIIKIAAEIALGHHEKYDGTGYPNGLRGSAIPLSARIVAIADFFDALTMDRCYRKAKSDETVFKMIRVQKGKHFDPKLADIFIALGPKLTEIRLAINKANHNSN